MAASATNNMPNFDQRFVDKGLNSKDWYFFLVGLYNGLPPALETPITPGVSPYEYTAPVKGSVILSAGTVSLVEFTRDGVSYYDTGQTAGMFTLNAQDRLRITYAVLPTMVFVPT